MGKKQITMRDIAKACGVSVATVSYVLSHSEKEKISHDTRLRVMETATRLKYCPRPPVQGSFRRSGYAAIVVNLKPVNHPGKKLLFSDLASELGRQLQARGFQPLLFHSKSLERDAAAIASQKPDAVFMIDVDNARIRESTKAFYAPIIFMDCELRDPFFCKVLPDYEEVLTKARATLACDAPFLVLEDILSSELLSLLIRDFAIEDVFIRTPEADVASFLHGKAGRKGIVLGDLLAAEAAHSFPPGDLVALSSLGDSGLLPPEMRTLYVSNRNKAAVAVELMEDLLALGHYSEGDNRLLLECEDTVQAAHGSMLPSGIQ